MYIAQWAQRSLIASHYENNSLPNVSNTLGMSNDFCKQIDRQTDREQRQIDIEVTR